MKKELYEYPPVEQWKWRSYDGKTEINVDDFIIELIHKIWNDDDLRNGCNERIEEIKFLTTSDDK